MNHLAKPDQDVVGFMMWVECSSTISPDLCLCVPYHSNRYAGSMYGTYGMVP